MAKGKKKGKFWQSLLSYLGFLLMVFSVFLFISQISYLMNGYDDQSQLAGIGDPNIPVENVFGKIGAQVGHFMIFESFGVATLLIPVLLFGIGLYWMTNTKLFSFSNFALPMIFILLWLPLFFATILPQYPLLSGVYGFQMKEIISQYIGNLGVGLLLLVLLVGFVYSRFKLNAHSLNSYFSNVREKGASIPTFTGKSTEQASSKKTSSEEDEINELTMEIETNLNKTEEELTQNISGSLVDLELDEQPIETVSAKQSMGESQENDGDSLEINAITEEATIEESQAKNLVEKYGEFDPKLDLSGYQFPKLSLLEDHGQGKLTIDQGELEKNKNLIVETLRNYKIEISKIKATIGPTVTLYEIVPAAGVRISKIKNLEDDIALSLSAEGIRIIAPIPGKGTIGIEVANSSPSVVSMRSVIASEKFQKNKFQLPIALGKTISNETYIADLAKMPHLLMAGATGQGKSVGINAILTSLLYKRHPAELKFVLVDPKKVELTLYNKIERHYLAMLPNSEEAIITDTTKVIHTLNSLCIEMDNRYELLKDAMVRNLSEYNEKFKNRRLNPDNGHRFLPYIVLVIDEFADLIMTAGKEVETPIARLAQLARAIGIHLIVATQRPSVNVITGIIKANFPARLAFRVTSKIDSRTILDTQGADQLIGRGDMLFSDGNDLTRLQCPFVDTPEVEEIVEFIGNQKGYASAYLLPEYEGEESTLDVDTDDLDSMFKDAARVIVNAQQGSASLLQRKLKLGYNRAGRIIDQLEALGVVGPFEGSKARQVLIPDELSLEKFFNEQNL